MAVPSSDDRDFRFANHFSLPVVCVIEGTEGIEDPTVLKHGKMINSGFLNGMDSKDAIKAAVEHAQKEGFGKARINYKMRDAVFSRQRYWGEPVPVYFKDGIPYVLDATELPLELPKIDEYKPTETGEPPLARAEDWKYDGKYNYELTTMPGWAGSSWYFFRYMDPHNQEEFCSKEAQQYWKAVDLYIGGSEHATGHLLYREVAIIVARQSGPIDTSSPFGATTPVWHAMQRSAVRNAGPPGGLSPAVSGRCADDGAAQPNAMSPSLASAMMKSCGR